jgi:excisionase family DNA binding protein
VAEVLGVSTRTVERFVAGRTLVAPLRVGRQCRWRDSTIRAYLDQLEAQAR